MSSDEAAIKLGIRIKSLMDKNKISKYQVVCDTSVSKLQLNRLLRGDSVETKRTVFPVLEYLKLKIEINN